MLKTNAIKLAVAAVVACCSIASADWTDVQNPNSGIALSPSFEYDPDTGLISMSNIGPNGLVDSGDNTTLLGDDIGMISFQVTTNLPAGPLPRVLTVFEDGIGWAVPQVFAGKVQLSGNALGASFLPVSADPTPIIQLPTGLSLDDFKTADGSVVLEVGVNFNFDAPGGTLFDTDAGNSGNFRVIPEPASASLLLSAVLAGFGLLRKRS